MVAVHESSKPVLDQLRHPGNGHMRYFLGLCVRHLETLKRLAFGYPHVSSKWIRLVYLSGS